MRAHFGWTAEFARSVKRQVAWFLPWGGTWLFIIGGVESLGNETLSESLGRLAFFTFMASCGLFAAAVRDRIISRPKVLAWLRRSFAAGFAVLGARLALSER